MRKNVIYLTFDDGPEPGTREIYEVLKSQSVPATFFFVGENVIAMEDGTFKRKFPNWNLEPGLLKKIFSDPLFQIASHSQTQSHQFYQSYYKTGLRVNPKTLLPSATSKQEGRRSVLVDFELTSMAFSYALKGVPQQYWKEMKKIKDYGFRGKDVTKKFLTLGVKPYSRFLTARMPGTNRWRLPKKRTTKWDWKADRDDEADDLFANDYRVYGWDLEWCFSRSDGRSDMSDDINQEHKKKKDGWWQYYGPNISKDRPKETVAQMVKKTSTHLNNNAQVVILMHDRQFRRGTKKDLYTNLLLDFIKKCKEKGYFFDVLENYQP